MNVRKLVELSRKRESRKLRQAETVQNVINRCFFLHEPPMRLAFEKIMGWASCELIPVILLNRYFRLDRQGHFKNPVSRTEVPDYFDIVTRPMCWNTIDTKLDRHEYWDLQLFKVSLLRCILKHALIVSYIRMMSNLSSITPSCITSLVLHSTRQPLGYEQARLQS